MKTNQLFGLLLGWIVPGLCVIFLVGCSTAPKIDWASRVGNYTYDQAVLDLGPPDKSAKLTDGTMVAEWLTARGGSGGYTGIDYGYGSYHGRWPYSYYSYYGPVYHYYESPTLDYYLRLNFGPDGKLKEWKRFRK